MGIDLNPIACLISRVKTSPLPSDLVSAATEVVWTASQIQSPRIPSIPNLDHWFTAEVQRALAALTESIDSRTDDGTRDALRLALSSIIVRVSNQESDTRYAAVEKNVASGKEYNAQCRQQIQGRHNAGGTGTVEHDADGYLRKGVGVEEGCRDQAQIARIQGRARARSGATTAIDER